MTRISLVFWLFLLAACTTPTLVDLVKVEVRIVRAPAAATKVRVLAGGVVREAPLVGRGATLLFGAAATSPPTYRATVLDSAGNEVESLSDERSAGGARLIVTFDFRPCETDARLGSGCVSGLGVCAAGGHFVCAADHRALACDATPLTPGTELCNGADDDCDGKTDEPEDLEPPPCELGAGVCAHGKRTCLGAAGWSDCDYGPDYEKVETRCDGRDNDCDGSVDPMIGNEPATCGGCNSPCSGDESCVAGRCYDQPAVVSSSPHDEDWGVSRDAAITLRFSRAMDQNTVKSALSLVPAAPFATEWNAAGNELTVRPSASLAASTRYTLSLATSAHDLRGKALAEAFGLDFSTGPTPGLFAWGGSIDDPPYEARDSWLLALVPGAAPRWYRLEDGTSAPGERAGVLVADDAKHGRILLAGGTPTFSAAVSEVWALDPRSGWTKLVADVPGTGFSSAAGGVDETRNELVIYGGNRAGCLTGALRLPLDAPIALSPLAISGTVPGLEDPITAWVSQTRTLFVTQGYGDSGAPGCWQPPGTYPGSPKTYTLTLGANGFTAATSPYDIGVVHGLAAAAWDGTQLVVYGGDGSDHADEAWSLDGTGWHLLTQSGVGPGPMRAGSMVFDPVGRRFVVFGGDSPSDATLRNTVFAMTVSGRSASWTQLTPVGVPPLPRGGFGWTPVSDAGPLVPVR